MKTIVLCGVGHANAHVLKTWRHRPIAGARLVCVSEFPCSTYSGMLTGVLAGQYPDSAWTLDLPRLCWANGAELIVDEAVRIDAEHRRLELNGGTHVDFDVLSVNVGSVPTQAGIEIAGDRVLPIKPMQMFLERAEALIHRVRPSSRGFPLKITVIGGGAGGVEVAMCLPNFLQRLRCDAPVITVVTAESRILAELGPRASQLATATLQQRSAKIVTGRKISHILNQTAYCDDGVEIESDLFMLITGAAPGPLIERSELPKAPDGFLAVRPTLLTTADAPVFAVGDSGSLIDNPAPKAGVSAVRQAPVLWQNINRSLSDRPLKRYRPQRSFLKLLNTGDGRAIGEWHGITVHSRSAWLLKDWIDRRFVDGYRVVQQMAER